ncbi:MAG: glycosyltransferase family 4 protein [Planctomycetota bacterium]|nr:glycosyltransferase family 4 protein [Planctomycetaceae bacterium]MDQ3330828.1 glycosyltransferase family 4 protein [Planctomycetota bacterium]
MQIAIVTAGGAGMFCGSCMHDNSWAKALRAAGDDVTLIPTYTPLTLDEADQSERRIFLGGINVYLKHRSRFWRALPERVTHLVDAPWLIRLATGFGVSNEAQGLGELTLELLAGEQGPQARELEELVKFLADDLKPDAILFSNALLSGAAPSLRRRYDGSIWCVLQGDDIFLEGLPEPYRSQAKQKISQNAAAFTGFFTHSRYYADFMASYLSLPADRFRRVPLSIDLAGHDGVPASRDGDGFTVGYFARVCPEKGLHELLKAFRRLHERQPHVKLVAGGYLGKRDVAYFKRLEREHRSLGDAFRYSGSPATHDEKVSLIRTFDVLSVPTTYHEPKGLYVLEALANGVPVVQPAHGAFPELIEATGGGLLFEPGDTDGHAKALERLLLDPKERLRLGTAGRDGVRSRFSDGALVKATRELLGSSLANPSPSGEGQG